MGIQFGNKGQQKTDIPNRWITEIWGVKETRHKSPQRMTPLI